PLASLIPGEWHLQTLYNSWYSLFLLLVHAQINLLQGVSFLAFPFARPIHSHPLFLLTFHFVRENERTQLVLLLRLFYLFLVVKLYFLSVVLLLVLKLKVAT